MISIEELVGLPEFVETPETKSLKRKANAEFDMQFFDLLPQSIRDFLNESDVPFPSHSAAVLLKQYGNEKDAIQEIRRRVNDFKTNHFRAI